MTKELFEKSLDQLINYIKKITDEVVIYVLMWNVDKDTFENYIEQCETANEMLEELKPYYFDYDGDRLTLTKKELFETYYDTMTITFNKLYEIYFGYPPVNDSLSNNEYKFGYVMLAQGISRVFYCDAPNLDVAFTYFGKEMEKLFGFDAPEKIMLIEVRENGIEVEW